MAVTVTGAAVTTPPYTGYFIPTLWSGKLNAKFYAATVFGEISNTDYEGEISAMGDKVIINNIPDIAINDYSVGQSLSYETPTPSKVELVIDKAKYFGVSVSDVLKYQSKPELMSMFSDDASKQMAISIDRTTLLGTFDQGAAANKGATAGVLSGSYNLGTDLAPITLSAANVVPLITALSSTLDEQNVPEDGRFIVIPPFMRNWLMQSNLAQAYVTGDDKSILRNGKIGTIDRFTIYVNNLLPTALAGKDFLGATLGSALARTAIMAGHKSAITFASQITDVETLPNPTDFGQLVRGLNVFGYKVIKPEALCLALVK